jgi:addiction module HigA family antidote
MSVWGVLHEDFLKALGLTQYRLAKSLTVPPRRINEIVHGKRAITPDTALRLARFFGTSERFWLNLQTALISRESVIGFDIACRGKFGF